MNNSELALQHVWDLILNNMGEVFLSSPSFIFIAVVLGIYVPGIVFSFVDVYVSKRMSLKESLVVYWRAMKWYSALYVVLLTLFIFIPMRVFDVPAEAPSLLEFFTDILLYFLLGDFVSYVWHVVEHKHKWYGKKVHYIHHVDKPPLSVWTAMVVHPVEACTVFICFHIYGILFSIHPLTFAVAAFSITAVTMITHCGYKLPIYDWFFATAKGHYLHHSSQEPTNVSVVLTLCDRLFGTFRAA